MEAAVAANIVKTQVEYVAEAWRRGEASNERWSAGFTVQTRRGGLWKASASWSHEERRAVPRPHLCSLEYDRD